MTDKKLDKQIEDLKKAAAQAKLQQAKADALFLSIGDGALTTDEHGRISRINKTALDLLGFEEEELIGEWFPGVIVSEDENGNTIPTIERPVTKAFITGSPVSAKLFYRRKDGSVFPAMVTVSPFLWEDRPIGAIEVFRDFSQEYEIDKMKSEFISLASHQLRTPLSAVHMYTNMLAEGYAGELNERQQKYAETILYSSQRMNELINTLLNIASIEGGGIAISSRPTNLNKVIQEVIDESIHTAKQKEINVKVETEELPQIYTDPILVKEIYSNLFTNAIKYTPEKGEVCLCLKRKDDEILFNVKDTGHGIPKSEQAKIFTKFFRASNITRNEASGTGLGLYMAQGVAKSLGGTIWFESEEGKGTTFFFSQPARVLDEIIKKPQSSGSKSK